MTLTPAMEERLLSSSQMAVRWTLQATLQAISDVSGDEVFWEPEQMDRLEAHFEKTPDALSADAYLAWRWMIQGARFQDARDMGHFLSVAELATQALGNASSLPGGSAHPVKSKGKAQP